MTLLEFLVMATLPLIISSSISPNVAADNIPPSRNQDILVAIEEMQRSNYFTFVMLINMAPADLFPGNVTFLMPNDKTLAKNIMPESSVADFLLLHSIPSPLLFEHLEHFPTGSVLPTSKPDLVLKITNDGRRRFFLNNVRITSPNICTRGSSVRCHGIDGVIQASVLTTGPGPSTNTPPPPPADCHNNTSTSPPPGAGEGAVAAAPPPAPVSGFNPTNNTSAPPPADSNDTQPKKSASIETCNFGVSELVTACLMLLVLKLSGVVTSIT